MIFLYCLAGIIPLGIVFRCFMGLDKRVRSIRIKYAIAGFISIIFDTTIVILILTNKIEYSKADYLVIYGPFVLALISFWFYKMGIKVEKAKEADILAENAYDIMDLRNTSKKKINL
ncbi:MAG: hypothetical protein RR406_05555 [Bacilli bacterium]